MYRPLTNYFGGPIAKANPAIIDSDEELKGDALFFISTDGIFNCFSTNQLGKILANSSSLSLKAKNICKQALATGSPDNISCVLLKVSF
jgi:serine/threonine protein phosphatase PrpC